MLLLLTACTHPAPGIGDDSAPVDMVDEAAPIYDPTRVHEVEITMAEADWDALRNQTRSIYEMLDGDCLAQPFGTPYTYFQGQASFDGEALGTVGIRKKGLMGSASTTRPSLRLDTDHVEEGVRFHGLEKLVFNNNNQDSSRMRTCLAHGFYADAGLVAPRCSLAHVTVNGTDLGLYDNTESIDQDLVERVTGGAPRTMYEGTLSDFREGWLASFDPKDEASDGADLAAVVAALESDDDAVLAALDEVLDLDAFFQFWAAEALSGHWDSYSGNTNNFYVYGAADDGRLRFVASGPDATFDSDEPFGAGEPVWVTTAGALANRLIQIPEGRTRYESALRTLLDEVWDADERLAQIDAWKDLLHDYTTREERQAMEDLRDIVAAKADTVNAQLGGEVQPAELRGNPCFVEIGTVKVDFSTTFGSYPDGDVMAGGTATTEYFISGQSYPSTLDGVSAGWYGDGRALHLTISEIAAETWLAPYVVFDPSMLVDGAEIPIDGSSAEAYLLYNSADTNGEWATAAYLGNGSLTFDQAGSTDGDVISGSLNVAVLGSAE